MVRTFSQESSSLCVPVPSVPVFLLFDFYPPVYFQRIVLHAPYEGQGGIVQNPHLSAFQGVAHVQQGEACGPFVAVQQLVFRVVIGEALPCLEAAVGFLRQEVGRLVVGQRDVPFVLRHEEAQLGRLLQGLGCQGVRAFLPVQVAQNAPVQHNGVALGRKGHLILARLSVQLEYEEQRVGQRILGGSSQGNTQEEQSHSYFLFHIPFFIFQV